MAHITAFVLFSKINQSALRLKKQLIVAMALITAFVLFSQINHSALCLKKQLDVALCCSLRSTSRHLA